MRPNSSTPRAAKMKKSRKNRRPRLPTSGSACITVSSRARTDLAILSSFSTDSRTNIRFNCYFLKLYFHYGWALRHVAGEIETLSSSHYLWPRNAMQRAAVIEISLYAGDKTRLGCYQSKKNTSSLLLSQCACTIHCVKWQHEMNNFVR